MKWQKRMGHNAIGFMPSDGRGRGRANRELQASQVLRQLSRTTW